MFLTDGSGTEMPVEIIKRYNPDRKVGFIFTNSFISFSDFISILILLVVL